MKKITLSSIITTAILLPVATLAVTNPISNPTGSGNIMDINNLINNLVGKLWVVFAGIAVVMFIVAGVLFLTAQGQPEKIQTARTAFIWGVAGVVVGILAYSIITIAGSLIGA